MKYFITLTFVALLSQTVHSAPVVAEKSVDEVDSWLNEMEQALDKEAPAEMQEFSEEQAFMGGPAVDRNGRPVNREGPVDLDENVEWWGEEQVNNQETETDTEIGNVNNAPFRYESDNDDFQNANPMEYSEESQVNEMSMEDPALFQQLDENKQAWEESPEGREQEFWEENNNEYGNQQQAADELEYYERQQGAADMEYKANEMEEPANKFFDEPVANRMEEPEEKPWDEPEGGAWDKADDKPWAKPWNEPDDKPWDEDDAKPWARPGDQPLDEPDNQPMKDPAKTEENWEDEAERQGQEWESQPWNEPAKTDETWEEGWQAERPGQEWDEPESQPWNGAESQSWNEPAKTDETWEEGWQAEKQGQEWNEPANNDETWEDKGEGQDQLWNEPEDRSWNEPANVDDRLEEGWQAERQGQPWEEPARTENTWEDERGWQDDFEGERQDHEMSPDGNMQEENAPVESWNEPNEQDFEDLPFDDDFDNAAVQSDEYAEPIDDRLRGQTDEGEFQTSDNFNDIDVAEEMSINLDNALEDSDEFGYDMAKVPDDFKPEDKPDDKDKATKKPEDKGKCFMGWKYIKFTK